MIGPGRRLPALVVLAALALGTSGCGGGDAEQTYCATVKRYQTVFADDETGLDLITNLDKLQRMADDAPDDLRDEWQTFLTALKGLGEAISSVGLKPSDFRDGAPPAGISASAKTTVAQAADRLSEDDVVSAASGIEQEAKDVCKLQLGLS